MAWLPVVRTCLQPPASTSFTRSRTFSAVYCKAAKLNYVEHWTKTGFLERLPNGPGCPFFRQASLTPGGIRLYRFPPVSISLSAFLPACPLDDSATLCIDSCGD